MAEIPRGVRHKSHTSVLFLFFFSLLPHSTACWLFKQSQRGFNLDAFYPSWTSHDINMIFLSALIHFFFFFCIFICVYVERCLSSDVISLLLYCIYLWLFIALKYEHRTCSLLIMQKKTKRRNCLFSNYQNQISIRAQISTNAASEIFILWLSGAPAKHTVSPLRVQEENWGPYFLTSNGRPGPNRNVILQPLATSSNIEPKWQVPVIFSLLC